LRQKASYQRSDRQPALKVALSKQEAKAHHNLTEADFRQIGPPDLVQARSAHGVRYLYRIERLEGWVAAHRRELQQDADWRAKRRHAAQMAAETRRSETMQWAAQVALELAAIPRNLEQLVRDYFGFDGVNRQQIVDFVRWRFSNYPIRVKQLAKRTGAAEARQLLKERIDGMIRDCVGD
jgi:hypothetical protein